VAPALAAYLSEDTSRINFLPDGETYSPNKPLAEYFNLVGGRFTQTLEDTDHCWARFW